MNRVIDWFARNHVAANLLMLGLLVGGAITLMSIKIELFPEFSMDMITISVPYPGAAPAEVEETVCVRIEEEVFAIDGVKKVTSSAAEGGGTVTVELLRGADRRRVLDDVKTRVDAIDTFPEEAEKPIIQEVLMRQQVINLAVSGDVEELTLKRIAERVRDDLSDLDGVSQVQLSAARPYEISIEVSEASLRRYGLSLEQVAAAVRSGSLDLSGGSVKTRAGEVLLRTRTQAYRGADFERIVVLTRPDGTRLHLGEVAQVVDGFEDTDRWSRFNGRPSVAVKVFRIGDENVLDVAAHVRDYVQRTGPAMPAGVDLAVWADYSVFLKGRLNLLLKNGLQGLGLVFLILALFLRFRLAFWITLGIPISFMGAAWLMPSMDLSINMLSLFGFIVVLGIVVDDAIVVGESVFSQREEGRASIESAVRGAQRVAVPVTFAVLTSVVAFLPLTDLPGMMGKFFRVIPLTVIPVLLISWVESKLILPAHLSGSSALIERLSAGPPFSWWRNLQGRFERGLTWFARDVYQPALVRCLRWRYLTVSGALAIGLVLVGLVRGGFVAFAFFNAIEGDIVVAQLALPVGTPASLTAEALGRIERAALKLREELDAEGDGGPSVVRQFQTTVGAQPYRAEQQRVNRKGAEAYTSAELGEVMMELLPAEERTVLASTIVERWRELTGTLPGATELVFSADIMSPGDAIHVQLIGHDLDQLRDTAVDLKAELARFTGVTDIADSFRGGQQELRLDILPAAEALGLTRADLARQVRQAFHGEEAQRIQRGRDDVRVMVRFPAADRRTLASLEHMAIRTHAGDEVPFSSVARARLGRGYATIQRTDRRRAVSVTAGVDTTRANTNDVIAALEESVLPPLLARHPGVSYRFEGENREQMETLDELQRLFPLALLAIYCLMAVPFRSYLQPAIVMLAIPFGLVGAVLGHMLLGIEMSVLSLLGLVALSGVVVNDSLVMVDFVNRRRREGRPVAEAAQVAGLQRFRPILLTSLTTFAGLTPLILEKSVQAQFLIPMAVSLAYGVMFATLISLVLVPAGYLILEDLRVLPSRLFGGRDDMLPSDA